MVCDARQAPLPSFLPLLLHFAVPRMLPLAVLRGYRPLEQGRSHCYDVGCEGPKLLLPLHLNLLLHQLRAAPAQHTHLAPRLEFI